MMGFRAGIVAVMLALSGIALAESETQKIAEIGGEITVDADGKVKSISLANVKDATFEKYFVGKIKSWTFYPVEVNGKPVEATSKFRFNLIATYLPDNKLKQIEFSNIQFEPSAVENEILSKTAFKSGNRPNISYPIDAAKVYAGADVTVALDISADGKVKNADILSLALINTNHRANKFFVNEFSKNTLKAVRRFEFSKDELARSNCMNGCVRSFTARFTMPNSNVWQSFVRVPVEPIPWLIAAELKDLDDLQKSQLVRLKEDPTGKPIDSNG
jgi:hypothetical protein